MTRKKMDNTIAMLAATRTTARWVDSPSGAGSLESAASFPGGRIGREACWVAAGGVAVCREGPCAGRGRAAGMTRSSQLAASSMAGREVPGVRCIAC